MSKRSIEKQAEHAELIEHGEQGDHVEQAEQRQQITFADWAAWTKIAAAAGFSPERLKDERRAVEIAIDLHRIWTTPEYQRTKTDVEKYGRYLQQIAACYGLDTGGRFHEMALVIMHEERERARTLSAITPKPAAYQRPASVSVTPEAQITQLRDELDALRAELRSK